MSKYSDCLHFLTGALTVAAGILGYAFLSSEAPPDNQHAAFHWQANLENREEPVTYKNQS